MSALQLCPTLEMVASGIANPRPGIEIAVSRFAGRTRVTVGGELDISTAPELRAVLRACTDHDRSDLVVHLGGLDFLDARGLCVLVEARRRLVEHRRLSIASPSVCAQRLLDLTGLATLFSVDPGPAAAQG